MEGHTFDNWNLHVLMHGGLSAPPQLDPTLSHSHPLFSLPFATQPVLNHGVSRFNASCSFPDLMAAPCGLHELEEICKSLLPKSPLSGGVTMPETLVVGPNCQPPLLPETLLVTPNCQPPLLPETLVVSPNCQPPLLPETLVVGPNYCHPPLLPPAQTPRSRTRKNQQRVACQDGVSSDMWAWQKYGQKLIKGSPYPRSYYKCSTSKGCPARKHVERSRTDPSMFITTYKAEHNHPVPTQRKTLVGRTAHNFPTGGTVMTTSAMAGGSGEGGSPVSALSLRALTAFLEEEPLHDEFMNVVEEEEEMLLVEDMEIAREDEFVILMQDGEGTGDIQSKRIGDDFSDLLGDRCMDSPLMADGNNNNTEENDTGAIQLEQIGDDFSSLLDDPCFKSPWIARWENNTAAPEYTGAVQFDDIGDDFSDLLQDLNPWMDSGAS